MNAKVYGHRGGKRCCFTPGVPANGCAGPVGVASIASKVSFAAVRTLRRDPHVERRRVTCIEDFERGFRAREASERE
jgi:hypothetical protein